MNNENITKSYNENNIDIFMIRQTATRPCSSTFAGRMERSTKIVTPRAEVATLKRIAAIITDAQRSGNARFLAMLGGDFNSSAQGETATRICLSDAAEPLIRKRRHNVSR